MQRDFADSEDRSLSEFGNYLQISENKSMENQNAMESEMSGVSRALEGERNRSAEKVREVNADLTHFL